MKDRLLQLLDLEQLSPSRFADIIGVQRSSVSHVLSGRNKPSYDFLEKTLKAFSGLRADWLMLGSGAMYASEESGRTTPAPTASMHRPATLFDSPLPKAPVRKEDTPLAERDLPSKDPDPEQTPPPSVSTAQEAVPEDPRTILQVMVFYSDNTFHTYRPGS